MNGACQMKDISTSIGELLEENSLLKQRIRELEESVTGELNDREMLQQKDKKIMQGEERYRNILDNMEEAYYEVDLNGKLTFFNTTAVKNLGYTDDVMMGMHFSEYVDSDNMRKLIEAYTRVLQTGESVKGLDWEVISITSGTIPVESSISLMRDEQGRPAGFKGIIRDITRRKQAEKDLRESKDRLQREEERYRNILDNMEEAYYEVDLTGNLTFFNNTAVTNLGYTNSEMMGMNFRTYVDDENAAKVFDAYTRVYRTGEPVKGLDWELICKNGERIPIESSISLTRDYKGRPVGFRGIIRDITARKQAEKKLRESEEKYRLLAENASDIIFTLDSMLNITYISPSVTRLRGYTVDEAMKQKPADILTPKSLEFAMQMYAEEMKIEADGSGNPDQIRTFELELICKNGTTIWTEIAFTNLLNDEKQYLGFLGIAHDISERKRAEQALFESEMRFRNLTETARDVIITVNLDGVITYANPAARELGGDAYSSGSPLKDFLPPVPVDEGPASAADNIRDSLSYETEVMLPGDDAPHYFDVRSSTLSTGGRPSGILFVVRDTTERRRIEEEIRMLAIADPLTGLFNRRGFITLAGQQIKASPREKKKLLLLFIDLDGLKYVNDTYGHEEGDRTLKKCGLILKNTFRESDIVARLGGDEFAVLVIEGEEPAILLNRLKAKTDEANEVRDIPCPVSMSIGLAAYDPAAPCSIHELISRADSHMYEQKKGKKQARRDNPCAS